LQGTTRLQLQMSFPLNGKFDLSGSGIAVSIATRAPQ
jgi:hypothetical protein